MSDRIDWLPPLLLMEDHEGDWDSYLEALYEVFARDFVRSRPPFRGRPLNLKRHPISLGKEATFWHFISEGKDEESREIDLRRCERIPWPRPIIEAVDAGRVKCWSNSRGGETRHVLAVEDFSFVVVLADRGSFILPWTAYYVEHEHRRKKLRREYEDWEAQKR